MILQAGPLLGSIDLAFTGSGDFPPYRQWESNPHGPRANGF